MTTHSNSPARRKPPRFGIGSVVITVVLVAVLLLLGKSMVRHRFHEGGRVHWNGSIGQ